MKCPTCAAWSDVRDTRPADKGHRTNRRRLCANGHVFRTTELHAPVFCSAKQRQRNFLVTAAARAALWCARAEMRKRRAAGESLGSIAADFGVSRSAVWLGTK